MTVSFKGPLFTGGIRPTGALSKAATHTARYGLGFVKSRTPVDTGRMRQGWTAEISGLSVVFKNPVAYSGFVEYGTRKMSARAPLGRSWPHIKGVFNQHVRRSL